MMDVEYKDGHYQLKPTKELIAMLPALELKEIPTHGKPKAFGLTIIKAYLKKKDKVILPRDQIRKLLNVGMVGKIKWDGSESNMLARNKWNLSDSLMDPNTSQEIVINYAIDHFKTKSHYGIGCSLYLNLPTGYGKTVLGCLLIRELSLSTMIVVPNESIGEQWMEKLAAIGMKDCSLFYNNKQHGEINFADTGVMVVVFIVNTLRKKELPFTKYFQFIILDEAHEYWSTCNGKVCWQIGNKLALGLSASPNERKDGFDKWLFFHLGSPKDLIQLNAQIDEIKFDVKVRAIKYAGGTCDQLTEKSGTKSHILTIVKLHEDNERIQLIINCITQLQDEINEGEGIILFSETREYLDLIAKNIPNVLEVDDKNDEIVLILRGGIKKEVREKSKTSILVLTTYGYSRRGVDLPQMVAMILATPRRNGLNQIVGRILRRNGPPSPRIIYDIVDTTCMLGSQYQDRKKLYKARLYPIIETSVTPAPVPLEVSTNSLSLEELEAEWQKIE